MNEMDPTDICSLFHPTARVCKHLFSSSHGTFPKIDHIYPRSWWNPEQIQNNPLIDNKEIKLEINRKEKYKNHSYLCRLNNTLLNNQWIIKESRKVIPIFKGKWKHKYQNLWVTPKVVLRRKSFIESLK
jgi:hypothetical protein